MVVQDNCKLVKKVWFIPNNNKNIKFPHIGKVVIANDVEIATGCTIDRGSVDDTNWEKYLLDNQVHIAHNVKMALIV